MIDKLKSSAGLLCAFVLAIAIPTAAWAGPVEDFDVALKHYQNKKFELSAAAFGEFIMKNPSHERRPLADLYYGQSLMQLRRFADARVVFSEFLKANPSHPDYALAMYREAECSFFVNDFAAAGRLFAAFVEKFPENDLSAWGWYYLGESHLKQGNADRAGEAFQSGLAKFPNSQRATETRFGLARAYAATKQYDQAAAAFQEISKDLTNPRAADALFALGSMEFDAQRYNEAAVAFSTIRLKVPTYRQAAEAALNEGSAYYKLEQFDKAVEAFDAAAQSPREKLNARFWAGQARRSQNKLDDAIAINKAAYAEFKDDPNAAKLLYYWGDCEFRKGNLDAAILLFLQFADAYPAHEFADDSLHYAVDAALKAGELKRADELHQRFARDFPRSGLSMLESTLYGRILLAQAEQLSPASPISAEARSLLEKAVGVFDGVAKGSKVPRTSAWATLLLARTRSKLGDWSGVIEAATPLNERLDALDKPADFAESLYLTGLAASEQQQWTLADASFDRYLKLVDDPRNAAAALSQLVLARTKAGKLDELDALWQRFSDARVPAASMISAIQAAADAAYDAKRFADSARLYERLEKVAETPEIRATARSGLGYSKFYTDDFTGAAEAFGRLLNEPVADRPDVLADAAYMKGLSLEKGKQTEASAEAYRAGALLIAGKDGRLSDPPANAEAAWYAFRCIRAAAAQFEALNDIAKADESYAQAWEYLQKLPADKQADLDKLLYQWARANYVAKRYDQADQLYGRLLRNHPSSSFADDAAFFLAESMVLSGKALEAETELKKILTAPSTDDAIRPEVLQNLVLLTAERQAWDDTKKYASELIDRYPASRHKTTARYRLGEAALKSEDFETAKKTLAELRQSIVAGDVTADAEIAEGTWILSAEAEIAGKPVNYAEIDRLVAEFHQRFPNSKLTYQIDAIDGRSLVKRGEVEKARVIFEKVTESPDGKNTETAAQAHLRLADTYLLSEKAEDYQTAYRLFYHVAERYPIPVIQAAALKKAGEVQEKMDKKDGAADAYRDVVKKFPSSPEAEFARRRLKALGAESTPKSETPAASDSPAPAINPAIPSPP